MLSTACPPFGGQGFSAPLSALFHDARRPRGVAGSNDYTDVAGLSYEGGVDTLTLTARYAEAGIDEVTVKFFPGEVQDGISLSTSVFEPGDVDELSEAIYPGLYDGSFREWPRPELELARHMHPRVISDMLGLSTTAATRWWRLASRGWATYPTLR